MIKVSPTQLAAILAEIRNPQPISFIALVEAGKGVHKVAKYRAWVGSYSTMIANRLAREGHHQPFWTPKPRAWGVHVSPALVSYKNHFYLSCQILHEPNYLYLTKTLRGFRAVAKEAISHLIRPFSRARLAESQGVTKPVVHRDVRLDSLRVLSIGGKVYKVI